jgi:hypothetical protein
MLSGISPESHSSWSGFRTGRDTTESRGGVTEAGEKVTDICLKMSISQTFYAWQERFAGAADIELRELRRGWQRGIPLLLPIAQRNRGCCFLETAL